MNESMVTRDWLQNCTLCPAKMLIESYPPLFFSERNDTQQNFPLSQKSILLKQAVGGFLQKRNADLKLLLIKTKTMKEASKQRRNPEEKDILACT